MESGEETEVIDMEEDSLDEMEGVKEDIKRGRGRPSTTCKHVGRREKEEEKARKRKEEELEKRAQAVLSSDPPRGKNGRGHKIRFRRWRRSSLWPRPWIFPRKLWSSLSLYTR